MQTKCPLSVFIGIFYTNTFEEKEEKNSGNFDKFSKMFKSGKISKFFNRNMEMC